jgi:hypothetical protein
VAIKDRATGNIIFDIPSNKNVKATGTLTLRNVPDRRSVIRSGVSSHDFIGRNVDFEGERWYNNCN